MSRDQMSQEYYIGKIVSVLIEHKRILETLINKVYELQKVSNQNTDSIKSYLNTLYKYIKLVETYNNRLDELAKSFSENLKSLEPIVKGTDKNKPVLDRLERLEIWVAEEVERRQGVELKKQKLFFSTIAALLPTFVLVSITFLGGLLLDYALNYKAENSQSEVITPRNNR